MFDIFGEGSTGLKFVFAFIVVLALIALTAWLVRRFGSERLGGTGTTRGRQPRLAVIDAASVDGRRRLVLIRRDNVEHLMMIGGPTDVVVEANIVRAAAPARETQAPRTPAATDTLPRAVPLGEGSQWPLQPEPAPAARAEPPAPRMEPPPPRMEPPRAEPPMPRAPQRHIPAPPPAPAPGAAEEEAEWAAAEPEPAPPAPPPPPQAAPPRRARLAPAQDALAGLADELARVQPQPEPASAEPRAVRRDPRIARSLQAAAPPSPPPAPPAPAAPAPAPTESQFNSPADQNLAEMAQRLEAALRQPGPRAAPAYEQQPAEPEDYAPPPPPPRPPAPAEGRPARPARADRAPAAAAPKSSLYDSLEQEMASLLGRPNSKS